MIGRNTPHGPQGSATKCIARGESGCSSSLIHKGAIQKDTDLRGPNTLAPSFIAALNGRPLPKTGNEMDAHSPDVWVLTFKPTGDGPPTEIRIRRLLKHALRSVGLRCVRLGEPKAK